MSFSHYLQPESHGWPTGESGTLSPPQSYTRTDQEVREAEETGTVGANGVVSPGTAPNQPGELADALVPVTGHQPSEHTNMAVLHFHLPDRSIVCKLHLKYAPLLQLGNHSGCMEEPPPLPPPTPPSRPFQSKAGRRGRSSHPEGSWERPCPHHTPPGAPKRLASSGVEGPDVLVDRSAGACSYECKS